MTYQDESEKIQKLADIVRIIAANPTKDHTQIKGQAKQIFKLCVHPNSPLYNELIQLYPWINQDS